MTFAKHAHFNWIILEILHVLMRNCTSNLLYCMGYQTYVIIVLQLTTIDGSDLICLVLIIYHLVIQHSHGKWPVYRGLPIKNGDFPWLCYSK